MNPTQPGNIDYGTPPDTVTQQAERINAMVSQQNAPLSVSDPSVRKPGAKIETQIPGGEESGPVSLSFKNAERVELAYVPETPNLPAFGLSFTVGEVCVREHYISMLIVTDLGFKPTTTMKFDLKYRGKTIPVIFAGAEFEFQTVGIRGISFLIDKKRIVAERTRP